MSIRTCAARAVVALILLAGAPATKVARSANDPPSPCGPGPSAAELQLETALMAPANFDFYELPLVDFVDYLCERLPTLVLLDQVALAAEEYDPKQLLVSGTFANTPLRSALFAILLPLDLDLALVHDMLWITTRDAAGTRRLTRCYDVGELIDAWGASFPAPADSSGNRRRLGRDRKDMSYAHCEICSSEPATAEDALTDLVTSIVEPDAWDLNGGEGALVYAPAGGLLVVHQTYAVHRELEHLLNVILAAARAQEDAAGGGR